MSAETVSRGLDRVEYLARLHQLFTDARFTKALFKACIGAWRLRVHLDLGLHQFPCAFVELDIPLQEQRGGADPVDVSMARCEWFAPFGKLPVAATERADAIALTISREEGKTLPEGVGEVVRAGQIFRFFAGEVVRASIR